MSAKALLAASVLISILVGIGSIVSVAQQAGRTPIPDSVVADPAQHKVEFENDVVRVVRITYGPGANTPMHTHPAHCLTFVTDGKLKLTRVDGTSVDAVLTRGLVECNDAVVHSVQNVGGTPVQLVAFELKNQRTFKK